MISETIQHFDKCGLLSYIITCCTDNYFCCVLVFLLLHTKDTIFRAIHNSGLLRIHLLNDEAKCGKFLVLSNSADSRLLFLCQYIVYAKLLLMKTRDLLSQGHISSSDSVQSLSWWLARVILLQQRIMDERSSSLLDLFQVFIGESLHHFGTIERVLSYWGSKLFNEEISAIVSMIHLEAGIGEYTYGRADCCR